MSSRILLVEDEPGVALVVSDLLRADGHLVEHASNGVSGLRRATEGTFDLLVLDVMLPGIGGFEICHAVREAGFDGAILMLTAKGQVPDRVHGLRTGADDYLVKPFDPDEFAARVGALLRRVHKEDLTPVTKIQFGNVTADFSRATFTKNGKPISLAAKGPNFCAASSIIAARCSRAEISSSRFGPSNRTSPSAPWTCISPGCARSSKTNPIRPSTSSPLAAKATASADRIALTCGVSRLHFARVRIAIRPLKFAYS